MAHFIEQSHAETLALESPILPLVPISTPISMEPGPSTPLGQPSLKHIIQNLLGLMLVFASNFMEGTPTHPFYYNFWKHT